MFYTVMYVMRLSSSLSLPPPPTPYVKLSQIMWATIRYTVYFIELSTDNTWWIIEWGLYGLWFKGSYVTLLLPLMLLFIARFAV